MSGVSAEVLLLCLVCGVLSGLLFAAFELLRVLFSLGRILTAALDLLFCFLTAVATFLLSLAVSAGYLRFFQIACEAVGFLCVQVTVTHGICRFLPRIKRRGSALCGRSSARFGARRRKSGAENRKHCQKAEKSAHYF